MAGVVEEDCKGTLACESERLEDTMLELLPDAPST
jgi:hypothetical protein